MTSELSIERLSAADIASNVALSSSVGWKDVAGDWRVLHDAALVLGARRQGQLIAQGALGDYGTVATLAKMVVAPHLQRARLGSRLLDRLLAEADARGLPVGLCAAPPGRRLYDSRRFVPVGELVVVTGSPSVGKSAWGVAVALLDAEPASVLDRHWLGCDRSRMLRARLREACAAFLLPEGGGYGLATAQGEGWLVGPVVARGEAEARLLTAAIFRAAPGPIRIDVPVEQHGFRDWLAGFGLRELGTRAEMARGAARLPWQVPQRFALATQAWC